jgi:hypothetical protein
MKFATSKRGAAAMRPSRRIASKVSVSVSIVALYALPALAECAGNWTQPQPVVAPSARSRHVMVFDSARDVTVLFGGYYNDGSGHGLGDTWEWDGTNWALKTPSNMPSARNQHAMAYDSARGVSVLFGGQTLGADIAATWEWDGTNWAQMSPMPSPNQRFGHAMAYDVARGATVLFGGYTAAPVGDTWVWTGTQWLAKSPATSPPGRFYHAMAYDELRGVTVLFGGSVSNVGLVSETWEWDGSNWSQKFPASSPSPRTFHAMAYDNVRGVMVLFGGYTDSNLMISSAETWEWDGTNWSKQSPAAAPSARAQHAMAYDSARDVTWLFGGFTGQYDNETWRWRVPKFQITGQPVAASVSEGEAAMFSVSAAEADPLTFARRRNGATLADGANINGSATATLTINPTTASDAGDYDCEVSIGCDAAVSQAATLTVVPATAAATGCGTCGAGMAAMMPFVLLGLGSMARRRRLHDRNQPAAH